MDVHTTERKKERRLTPPLTLSISKDGIALSNSAPLRYRAWTSEKSMRLASVRLGAWLGTPSAKPTALPGLASPSNGWRCSKI